MMGAIQNVRMPVESEVSPSLQWTAIVLRAAFIGLLMVLILRVSQPQSETVWSAYETTGDLVRLVLGLGACLWMGIQAFSFPKDTDAHRIWLYLGVIGVPAALSLVAITW
jgi:cell division protein FtsW (lipid II flippase)